MILYELGGPDGRRYSLFSWRSRMALAHKGLAVEYRPVALVDKAAIAFSGQDKVPILIDGDTTVFDSWRIAEYLEDTQPGASLFGGAVGRGLAFFVNGWVDRQLIPAAAPFLLHDIAAGLDAADGAYLRAGMEKTFGQTLEALQADRDEKVKPFRRALDPARTALRTQPFLSGPSPAYPDYILFSVFQWARLNSGFELLAENDAPLRAWRDRMLDLFDGLAAQAPAWSRTAG